MYTNKHMQNAIHKWMYVLHSAFIFENTFTHIVATEPLKRKHLWYLRYMKKALTSGIFHKIMLCHTSKCIGPPCLPHSFSSLLSLPFFPSHFLCPILSIPFSSSHQLSGIVIVLLKSSQPITSYFSSNCSTGSVCKWEYLCVCCTAEWLECTHDHLCLQIVCLCVWVSECVSEWVSERERDTGYIIATMALLL